MRIAKNRRAIQPAPKIGAGREKPSVPLMSVLTMRNPVAQTRTFPANTQIFLGLRVSKAMMLGIKMNGEVARNIA